MSKPWYKTARRWCQANLTENDGRDCDVNFWRAFWKKNRIQGTIVNAGGTVAYFPSENPHQYRAKFLGNRDLLKEFIDAAREEGVAVMARMDINQAAESLFKENPSWFVRDIDGNPVKQGERYRTCVNGPYYTEHIPKVMQEIVRKYKPDALGDNSWTGSTNMICHCENCKRKFKESFGIDLPKTTDYNDKTYRLWLQWSVKRRTEIWNYFNKITQEMGGDDCLWMGMLHPEFYPVHGINQLYDEAQLVEYGKAHMVDSQSRQDFTGFEQNAVIGLTLHQLFGENTLILNSSASYHKSLYAFRKTRVAPVEMQSWMISGLSAGIVPSPHFIGGVQDDKRMFDNCTPVMTWHEKNEKYLFDRELSASVGVAWSKENSLFYGQTNIYETCHLPFYGMVRALIRKRIPYFPINTRNFVRDQQKYSLLIMPELGVMSDEQLASVEQLVKAGKSIIFSGCTGMLDELGYVRKDFPLDKLFGINRNTRELVPPVKPDDPGFASPKQSQYHNYLRLTKERHEIAKDFETDFLPFHGQYYDVRSSKLETVANYIPPFPIYPPEFSYMDDDKRTSDIPMVLAGETGYGGRVVYFAGDIDRRFAHGHIPDLGDLLGAAIMWALRGDVPIKVKGPGRIDCRVYKQENAFIVHLINLTGTNEWPDSLEEFIPTGPYEVSVKTGDKQISKAGLKVAERNADITVNGEWTTLKIDRITGHELIVLE